MPLFRDPGLQRDFESRGYVVLRLFDDADLERVERLYDSLDCECTSTRLSSVAGHRPELFRPLRDAFREIGGPALERHFVPHDVLLGNFLIKPQHPAGTVPPHQDWTVLDDDG